MNVFIAIKDAAGKVLHTVETPFEELGKIEAAAKTALSQAPALKAATLNVVSQVEAIGAQGAKDFAADGLNITGNIALITSALALLGYLKDTYIPLLKETYGELTADLDPAPAPAVADPAPALVAVGAGGSSVAAQEAPALVAVAADPAKPINGPGLHNIAPQ